MSDGYEPLEIVLAEDASREVFGNPPRQRRTPSPTMPYKGLRVTVALVRDSSYRSRNAVSVTSSSDVFELLEPMRSEVQEVFVVLMINARGKANGVCEVHRGTLTEVAVLPADVLRPVLVAGVPGFIVAHNHPSGEPEPSQQDVELTQQLKAAAKLLGLQMLDHLVVGEDSYISFADRGML